MAPNLQSIALTIKSANFVSERAREARLGLRLEASDYLKLAIAKGFTGTDAWAIAQRAFLASESQAGRCPRMTWQQDAKWTKF